MTTLTSDTITVQTRQGRVSTPVERVGSGEPLLYLHGPFGLVERPLIDMLAAKHTVYIPAHPGFEGTEGLETFANTHFDLILHYDEVLDALGLPGPIDVVGHSFGGSIAADLAAILPHRVRRLVLISPLGVWLDERPQPDLFGLTPGALGRTIFHDPTTDAARGMLTPPEDREEARNWNRARRRNLIGAVKFMWPLPDQGFSGRAYRLRAPTLLVWGEHDEVVAAPEYVRAYRELIPEATAEVCADAGHMVVVEQPDAVGRAVLAHLEG
jgi:pimeloyl-ACP methyl ester carboxylesterase